MGVKQASIQSLTIKQIEDELGEGEFGVVYKWRRVDIEGDDDEYSTLKTSISNKYGNYTPCSYKYIKIDEDDVTVILVIKLMRIHVIVILKEV